jgi:hypothetical protein
MKQETRDNLIYLAVGLSMAALLAADAFYAVGHDREVWVPSRFAFRIAAYMAILAYFVGREVRKVKATVVQTSICVLLACILHLGLAFSLRHLFSGPFSLEIWGLAVAESFIFTQAAVRAVRYLH